MHGVCVQADGKRLFVTVETDHTLRIIDTATQQTIGTRQSVGASQPVRRDAGWEIRRSPDPRWRQRGRRRCLAAENCEERSRSRSRTTL